MDVGNEARDAIEAKLKKLKSLADVDRDRLRADALREAASRRVDDFRTWLREKGRLSNDEHNPGSTAQKHRAANQARRVVVVKQDTEGRSALFVYRGRLARVRQRIALIAGQLVCVYPGCGAPAIYCHSSHNASLKPMVVRHS